MNATTSLHPRIVPALSPWRAAIAAYAIAALLLVVIQWSSVMSLLHVWRHDGTYQFAFLIPPISLWLAWRQRQRLIASPPAPALGGLFMLVALMLLWLLGRALDVNLARHIALVAAFPVLVWTLWGLRALWVLRFALAYLLAFAVPWGDAMVGPLQDITARMAVGALQLSAVPVWLDGRQILTPSAVWMVEAACSGVKFFLACAALGILYGQLMYTRTVKRVVFALLSAVVPIMANGLRVYFTILIGETWGVEYASGADHVIFGWQFFGVVLVLLFTAGWFWRDAVAEAGARRKATYAAMPLRRMLVWPLAWVVLVAAPWFAAEPAVDAPVTSIALAVPDAAGWHARPDAEHGWKPQFAGANGEVRAVYRQASGTSRVALFHAVYAGAPRRGHALVTYGNRFFDPSRQRLLETRLQRMSPARGGMRVRELQLDGTGGRRLVWYWYRVDGRDTTSPVMVKLLQAWQALRGGHSTASVWALSVPLVHADVAQARASMRRLAAELPAVAGRHAGDADHRVAALEKTP